MANTHTVQLHKKNGTQSTLANNIWLANNPLTRLKGLLGKSSLQPNEGLWITPCNGVHSCFMQFVFDAVFVDKNGEVLHIIRHMTPWKFSPMIKGAKSVLELPDDWAAQHHVDIGDTLILTPNQT